MDSTRPRKAQGVAAGAVVAGWARSRVKVVSVIGCIVRGRRWCLALRFQVVHRFPGCAFPVAVRVVAVLVVAQLVFYDQKAIGSGETLVVDGADVQGCAGGSGVGQHGVFSWLKGAGGCHPCQCGVNVGFQWRRKTGTGSIFVTRASPTWIKSLLLQQVADNGHSSVRRAGQALVRESQLLCCPKTFLVLHAALQTCFARCANPTAPRVRPMLVARE